MIMRSSHVFRSTGILLALASLAMCSGCGSQQTGPKTVPAGGTVTYQGKPVPDANVAFLGDGTIPPATGITNANGEFQLRTVNSGDGAVPGSHQVTISKFETVATGPADNSMEAAAKAAQTNQPTAPKSLIPEKYSKAATSGLSYTVEASKENNFKIELTD